MSHSYSTPHTECLIARATCRVETQGRAAALDSRRDCHPGPPDVGRRGQITGEGTHGEGQLPAGVVAILGPLREGFGQNGVDLRRKTGRRVLTGDGSSCSPRVVCADLPL